MRTAESVDKFSSCLKLAFINEVSSNGSYQTDNGFDYFHVVAKSD
jgi:hypothetical protein